MIGTRKIIIVVVISNDEMESSTARNAHIVAGKRCTNQALNKSMYSQCFGIMKAEVMQAV